MILKRSQIILVILVALLLSVPTMMIGTLNAATTTTVPPPADNNNDTRPDTQLKARTMVEKLIDTAGGMQAWQNLRQVTFTVMVLKEQQVLFLGHYKVKMPDREITVEYTHQDSEFTISFIMLQDERRTIISDAGPEKVTIPAIGRFSQGAVLRNKLPLGGDEAAKLLNDAVRRAAVDVFWFSLPFNLLDPEIDLDYLGTREQSENTYEIVRVTNRNPLMVDTPVFELYIDPAKQHIEFWKIVMADQTEHMMTFEDYRPAGPVTISGRRLGWGDTMLVVWFPVATAE